MKKDKTNTMKKQKFSVLVMATLFTLAFSFSTATAQESVNATGGNVSGSGGTVSYTIGQTTYETHSGTGGTAAQGVQQPYEIWVVTSIDEAIGITLSVSAYPNPTKDFLTLEIKDFDPTGLTYQLFDMSGKMLEDTIIIDSLTKIDMNGLVPAVYFVRVVRTKKEVKTFKVVKN